MTLTKNDIVMRVSEMGFSKQRSVDIIENLLVIMKDTLAVGEDVLISRFGKFCIKTKGERKGRNPATGDEMILRDRKVVTFKCSGKLRDKINGDA
ncbi:integration host factor subunit alpha [Desulfoluna spongiiphila]|uniref:Integration host factor subunit alpha n=1 Tax=Desulfoluna spongiiphila TaxID=419481 RepID=A0A1G5EMA0_9BACT|nr:integration host factor subunit alpha [Desulfoluna spongiiphila]SCY28082.1 integration host factor subunit alpha [Desulfoluna spongiiphila]VVS91213.1 histone-like dna-binding protein [Desulfoluna spongiiphila]